MIDEKRQKVRFRAKLPARLVVGESLCDFQGVVQDINMGGLRVSVDSTFIFVDNRPISIYLFLPNETFEVSGELLWTRYFNGKKELGIRFTRIPDSYKEDIYNFIFKYHRQELTQKWWHGQTSSGAKKVEAA